MLFRIMVWDVHPIVYLHPTTEKEKVLLPPRNNREEIATSTQSSLQVQPWRASVARMTPLVNRLWFCDPQFFFFFLVFSQKLRGQVTRNIEKKHMALVEHNCHLLFISFQEGKKIQADVCSYCHFLCMTKWRDRNSISVVCFPNQWKCLPVEVFLLSVSGRRARFC